MNDYKYIDLSGYAFTGKAAVIDLLREFKGYKVPSSAFEFALFRTPHGLLELEDALINDWSPVRSSEAIREFKRLIKIYSGTRELKSRLFSRGYQYDEFFPNFSKISNDYINSLIATSWSGEWPFATNTLNDFDVFCRKILYKLGFSKIFEHPIYLSAPNETKFMSSTKKYVNDVLSSAADEDTKAIVLHNAFEPFNPARSLKYFDNAKIIIIDRDPRDTYLAALAYVGKNGQKGWSATTGTNVQDFVCRFKLFREKVRAIQDPRILKINFEDLVLNYEVTLSKILHFFEEESSIHVSKKESFNPDVSKKGIGMWKSTPLKEEMKYIASELKYYCKEF